MNKNSTCIWIIHEHIYNINMNLMINSAWFLFFAFSWNSLSLYLCVCHFYIILWYHNIYTSSTVPRSIYYNRDADAHLGMKLTFSFLSAFLTSILFFSFLSYNREFFFLLFFLLHSDLSYLSSILCDVYISIFARGCVENDSIWAVVCSYPYILSSLCVTFLSFSLHLSRCFFLLSISSLYLYECLFALNSIWVRGWGLSSAGPHHMKWEVELDASSTTWPHLSLWSLHTLYVWSLFYLFYFFYLYYNSFVLLLSFSYIYTNNYILFLYSYSLHSLIPLLFLTG